MNYLDRFFPPSLTRITRSFERTRARLANFAARAADKGQALEEQARYLQVLCNNARSEADRATRLAIRFTDLLN